MTDATPFLPGLSPLGRKSSGGSASLEEFSLHYVQATRVQKLLIARERLKRVCTT